MNTQQKVFYEFIQLLHINSCLEYLIVVGSWAEFLYKEAGVLKSFKPNIRTRDIDFLIKNMRKPDKPKNLLSLAAQYGYGVSHDYMSGVTKMMKDDVEIEFLLGKRGAGQESALKTNLGVTAQTLWHMDIAYRNVIQVQYLGMDIAVPSPEAYTIHKMVINGERKTKQEKDRQAILNIFPYIDKNEFYNIYSTLTKKEKHSVDSFIEDNLLELDISFQEYDTLKTKTLNSNQKSICQQLANATARAEAHNAGLIKDLPDRADSCSLDEPS